MPGLFAAAMDGLAHGYCLLWDKELLWLHAGSDTIIAAAYFVIPLSLVRFIRARRDVPFNSIFLCFGAFILLCGTTHVLGVYNIWVPDWWVSGGVKGATAIVSIATAGLLLKLMPQAIALPSPTQLRLANEELERVNARLRTEVAERQTAQAALAIANETAEALVLQRTAELAAANEQLRRSEARYRAFVQASGDLVWTARADGTTDDPASINAFIGLPADAPDEARLAAMHPEDREQADRSWAEAVSAGKEFTTEYRLERKDGELRHVSVHAVPVRETDGSLREWVGVLEDVTEKKAAEAQLQSVQDQLQQAQRMEAVGRLAGGIAHDFNNLLTVITGAGALVVNEIGETHPARRDAEDVVAAGSRAAALTAQLLAYSRKQVLQPRRLDMNTVLRDIQGMLRRLIHAQIEIVVRLEDALGAIEADPHQLEQVILNLALNARDAMPTGGTLTFETQRAQVNTGTKTQHLGVEPGEYVMLAVSDTGSGMDEATRQQIFEPFFTTKLRGEGTGLGLATVYGIVRQSGGRIYVYSEPGRGTSFKLYFPRVAPTVAGDGVTAERREVSAGGKETVMLVEDTDEVRTFVARVLERAGYVVHQASSPALALALLEQEQDLKIDLLLTDVIMPGMNGRELADRVLPKHPEAVVLYMSGYTDIGIVQQGVLAADTNFLQKPFSLDQLLTEVRKVLDTRVR